MRTTPRPPAISKSWRKTTPGADSLTDPRKSNCGSRLASVSGHGQGGPQEPGAPFIKLQAVFLVCVRTVFPGGGRAPSPEPGAGGMQARGTDRRAPLARVKPKPPHIGPKGKGSPRGVAGGRPGQHLGRDSRVGPRGDRPPCPAAPTATGPGTSPGPCGVRSPPARASSAGAPSAARPDPGALTPGPLAASSYCAGVRAPRPPRLRLRLRPLSRRPSAPGHRPPRPAGGPAPRPRQPSPTTGRRGGAGRAPGLANPAPTCVARSGRGNGRAIGQVC